MMQNFIVALIINLIFTFSIFGADFRDLTWGMSQQEVVALKGSPVKVTENKLVFGTLTQTLTYNDYDSENTYDLLFIENLLTNVSFRIAANKKSSANDVHKKFREETVYLEKKFQEPVLVEKMDNSTKKFVYENLKTKVTVIYYNTPIKADYINRSAYLNVTYSNRDPVLKAEIKNRKRNRVRGY